MLHVHTWQQNDNVEHTLNANTLAENHSSALSMDCIVPRRRTGMKRELRIRRKMWHRDVEMPSVVRKQKKIYLEKKNCFQKIPEYLPSRAQWEKKNLDTQTAFLKDDHFI